MYTHYNSDRIWSETSEAAAELVLNDARATYRDSLEHHEELMQLHNANPDAQLGFHIALARTAVVDARRDLDQTRRDLD